MKFIAQHSQPNIINVEYSTDGSTISYSTTDKLNILSSTDCTVKNIISVNTDKYKYFQKNTLIYLNREEINYLSVYDNKIMRKFKVNKNNLNSENAFDTNFKESNNSLSVDSGADLFMTVFQKNAYIWDIRMNNPIKKISCIDSIGALSTENDYAITNGSILNIFDRRNDKNVISTKNITNNFYKKISYSNDNNKILLQTKSEYFFFDKYGTSINNIGIEQDNDGEMSIDSNHLYCCSRKWVFSYKISDRSKLDSIETTEINNCVRVNPNGKQIAVGNENGLQLFEINL